MMSVQWPSTKCSFIKTSSSSRQRSWTGPRHGTHPGPLSTHTKFSLEEMVLQKDSLNQNNHFDNKVHKSQKHAGYSCKKHRQHKHSDKWKLHHMADFRFCWKEWDPASFNLCSQEKKKRPKSQLRLTHKFIYGRNIKQLTTQSTEFRCSETRHEKSQIERNMELFNLQSQQTTNMNKPSTQNATNTPN